jgi:hypothetical protein
MLKSNITYNIKRKLIGSPKFIFGECFGLNRSQLHRIIISIILLQIFCRRLKIELGIVSVKVGSPYDCLSYRPQFYFRTTDVTGACKLPDGVEMVMPGDNVKMDVELLSPIAMEDGLRFAIREGGRTVGAGVVSKVTD